MDMCTSLIIIRSLHPTCFISGLCSQWSFYTAVSTLFFNFFYFYSFTTQYFSVLSLGSLYSFFRTITWIQTWFHLNKFPDLLQSLKHKGVLSRITLTLQIIFRVAVFTSLIFLSFSTVPVPTSFIFSKLHFYPHRSHLCKISRRMAEKAFINRNTPQPKNNTYESNHFKIHQ